MEDTQWSEGERLLGFSFLFVHRSILNSMTSDLLSSSAPDQVGDLVIPVIPEDERLWVPQAENVWFRPLMFNTVQAAFLKTWVIN